MLRKAVAARVSSASRYKKLRWLMEQIEPGSTVLLVGVSSGAGLGTNNFVERGLVRHARATALVRDGGQPSLACMCVPGDALDLPFDDGSFDYVVSNAVIEHVGGRLAAKRMVAESRRVACRKVFHTTPYRWFPIEVHTQIPFLHWLPRRWYGSAFRVVGRAGFSARSHWLFGRRELRDAGHGARIHQLNALTLVGEWDAVRHTAQGNPSTDAPTNAGPVG